MNVPTIPTTYRCPRCPHTEVWTAAAGRPLCPHCLVELVGYGGDHVSGPRHWFADGAPACGQRDRPAHAHELTDVTCRGCADWIVQTVQRWIDEAEEVSHG